LFGRILSVAIAVSIVYFVMMKFGLSVRYVPFVFAFYVACELVRVFRPTLLAISIFFAAKVLFDNVQIEINELYLLLFLIFISLAWVDFAQPFTASIGLALSALFGYLTFSYLVILPIIAIAITTIPSFKYEGILAWRCFALAVSIILAIYIITRPLISDRPGIVSLIDWIIVLGIALKAFSKLRFERGEISESKEGFVEISESLDRAVEIFLNSGDKTPLVIVLSKILSDSMSLERLCNLMRPLVEYRDLKIPKPAFKWEVERIVRKNIERRRKVVEEIMRGVRDDLR